MTASYRRPGLVLGRGTDVSTQIVQDLQRDLRRLGYLKAGVDGKFGPGTEAAVRALQVDLLSNDGRGSDGRAPVALRDFNRGRIAAVTGVCDEAFAACLDELINDPAVPQLPHSNDPERANREAVAAVLALTGLPVPVPFLLTVLQQESDLYHFRVPKGADEDDVIVVGLDHNDAANPDHITSRGYGLGQFTLFHHPPTPAEIEAVMLDPRRNVERAVHELREKFDGFILGPTSGTQADDRLHEIAGRTLRVCRYAADDPRFLRDCRNCASAAPRLSLGPDVPLYPGSRDHLLPTPYHPEQRYDDVPDRKELGCDWPYAVRRYNGSGMNSYHYQAQVLIRLDRNPVLTRLLPALGEDRAG